MRQLPSQAGSSINRRSEATLRDKMAKFTAGNLSAAPQSRQRDRTAVSVIGAEFLL
jgi:hypothetical protein